MSSYTIFAVSDLVVIAIASYLFGRYEWDNHPGTRDRNREKYSRRRNANRSGNYLRDCCRYYQHSLLGLRSTRTFHIKDRLTKIIVPGRNFNPNTRCLGIVNISRHLLLHEARVPKIRLTQKRSDTLPPMRRSD